jgi:hypothetical protein
VGETPSPAAIVATASDWIREGHDGRSTPDVKKLLSEDYRLRLDVIDTVAFERGGEVERERLVKKNAHQRGA